MRYGVSVETVRKNAGLILRQLSSSGEERLLGGIRDAPGPRQAPTRMEASRTDGSWRLARRLRDERT